MIIVIPHFNSSKYRERNLKCVLHYYLETSECDIVISEQNGFTDVGIKSDRITHITSNFSDSTFRKSALINAGVKECEYVHDIMLVDNDCILQNDMTFFMEQMSEGYDYYVPFNSINFLNEGHTRQYIRDGKFTQSKGKSHLHVNRYTGGVIVFTRDLFEKVGGFEESIIGWGKEDDVFLTKCRRTNAFIGRIETDSELLHLFHPPSSTKEYLNSPQYIKNSKMLALFKRMTDNEFNDYLELNSGKEEYLDKLFNDYDKAGKLETKVKVYCGSGYVKFDTSAYTIIPDKDGNVGLEELFKTAYNEDGEESVAHTIREIDKNCGKLSPDESSIVNKYRKKVRAIL